MSTHKSLADGPLGIESEKNISVQSIVVWRNVPFLVLCYFMASQSFDIIC